MKIKITSIAFSVFIIFCGYIIGILHANLIWDPKSVELTQELDLTKSYFFKNKQPPIEGIMPAGEKIHITMKKGGATYIQINTVIDNDALLEASKQLTEPVK